MRKSILTALALLLLCPLAKAQEVVNVVDSLPSIVNAINSSQSKITVVVPEAVQLILRRPGQPINERASASNGYRIEAYADNNARTARSTATARKNAIAQAFPNTRTYLTFESPYWRLRVGDYRTYAEADAALRELRAAFPAQAAEMRIVRSRIIVSE